MKIFWNKEEIDYLTKLYVNDGLSISELYPIFIKIFNRSIDSIAVKIGRLKLRHSEKQIREIKSRLNSGENNNMYGKPSPMRGLTKNNSEKIKKRGEKLSIIRKKMFELGLLPKNKGKDNPMFGKVPWSKGKTKFTDERLFKSGLLISKHRKEYWNKLSESERNIILVRLNNAMIQCNKATKIENIIEEYLKENNIEYIKNYRVGKFIADFYLSQNKIAIECDGDYWHANPLFYNEKNYDKIQLKNIDRDKRKKLLFENNGIELIRFWEHDIIFNIENIKKNIWELSVK